MLESLVLPTSVLDEPEQLPYDPRPPNVGVVPSGPFLYHGLVLTAFGRFHIHWQRSIISET